LLRRDQETELMSLGAAGHKAHSGFQTATQRVDLAESFLRSAGEGKPADRLASPISRCRQRTHPSWRSGSTPHGNGGAAAALVLGGGVGPSLCTQQPAPWGAMSRSQG
jgi:hypothetical protein